MDVGKVFTTGRSQAIRIPKKFRFHTRQVRITRRGNDLILSPIAEDDALQTFLDLPSCPDFEIDRTQSQTVQDRELFK